ncbi:HAMP domain-containing histidine kinase [Lactobacillus sp. PV037]|uniref:sensor histidine kinase n=1 Tax=unclassified Lactobacillus TaxID=2620435 RepID=UPI00224048D3|nr:MULTISPECIES: HAMP domain-containing sensor histidine kinase [unclassified Lactobacillus]QNQ82047.1 HAMP domain-containing histidine kinase [Lactobacillus sp. PV012]QNQ83918.1 HAMP domain-containing histidine kinase [Lactobacillus sp. PV037]
MIQKFRWKFIYLSITSLAIVLFFTMGTLLFFSYHQSSGEVNRVLTALDKNHGHLTPQNAQPVFGNQNDVINRNFGAGTYNPEAVYQYRYFTVGVTPQNTVQIMNDENVDGISKKQIKQVAQKIISKKNIANRVKIGKNIYAFRITKNELGNRMIIFLNESLIFNRFWILVKIAGVLSVVALIIFATVLILISKKAIGPIIRTYKKQKEFITNAGHELKTPLAIISANTEMQEMLGEDSEWVESTKQQTQRLTQLINNLIAMARTGETKEVVVSKVNFSQIVKEVTQSFKSLMEQKGLHYNAQIATDLNVWGEKHSLNELVNILLDNACKYCDLDGKISINLRRGRIGKQAILSISNTYAAGAGLDYKSFFERFYREDKSHNSKKSGFGIGLAMAKEMVESFGGKINVSYKNSQITFTVLLKLVNKKA